MAGGQFAGRAGLVFAALSGAGATSIIGSGLRALPAMADIGQQYPQLLIWGPLPFGALVAVAHVFWVRKVLASRRPVVVAAPPAPSPVRPATPAPSGSLRAQVQAAQQEGDGATGRWSPDVRN
ncbi:hypothetical protein [Niveispirillum irakense]|uniref:hypothetical protein n=1 Tax=Niveispirillum irakense TaxID=34011 RepID=UPI000422220F|nr:hypothetical protein [Niveispirillum irakense]